MATDTIERPLSERTVRNYVGAFSAWAASMVSDPAIDAVFLERIGMTTADLRAVQARSLGESLALNARFKRWQAQCGITEEQTPDERLALALANDQPVVD